MFNAILRDSDENFPTDPVSDPIADSRVLPIPCSITSFGSGALLKNSIGNWSRWLTDLFGIDDDDQENSYVGTAPFKTFILLKALSDLMMLPKDMLFDTCVRKEVSKYEYATFLFLFFLLKLQFCLFIIDSISLVIVKVCPMFGAPLIKRVLNHFVPDEFCPDPVPVALLEALESQVRLTPSFNPKSVY